MSWRHARIILSAPLYLCISAGPRTIHASQHIHVILSRETEEGLVLLPEVDVESTTDALGSVHADKVLCTKLSEFSCTPAYAT